MPQAISKSKRRTAKNLCHTVLDMVSSVFESTLKTKRLWIPTFVGMTDKKKALKDFKAYSLWLAAYSF